MLLCDFFRDVYCPLRLLGRSQRTVTLYEYSIRAFSRFLGRDATLDDLADVTVARHLAALLASGRAPAGVNKERDQLLAIWRLAARKRLVSEFPEIMRVREPEVVPTAWTAEEMMRLRISCNYVSGNYCGVPANLWWLALHEVLWSTGERISAVMQARWDWISGDVITVPAVARKGGQRANVKRLPTHVIDALEAIRRPLREAVFPWPHTNTYIYRTYHRILERAELDTSSRSKFHRIRRSHATHLKLAGGDPSTSLGHANPAVTARYLDPRLLAQQQFQPLPKFGGQV